MPAANGDAGAGWRLTQGSVSTLDEVMELRGDGDQDAIEFGKAEPSQWELLLFWAGSLGRGGLARWAGAEGWRRGRRRRRRRPRGQALLVRGGQWAGAGGRARQLVGGAREQR
ncbi:hypothetical protein T440DRAFT_21808 [Plenodomus tracheiphilus IPT5]|uniref:Uncharacterized protein n=1 Tax=Plenodomus tracheiphilus IPT5 TaxID=1408161 RepID=A0A6A7BC27_9PLEO|nr:hypothetical protein T440DRAFT_21808 [Plenodomus tracheiphilus IPT5]